MIGRGSTVENDTRIGARVRIQTQVYITAYMVIEDDVFVGPGVTHHQRRHDEPPRQGLRARGPRAAPRVPRRRRRRALPGVEIGEEAFIAAGALVTRDIPARAVAMGVPARVVRAVADEDLLERWR